jgi:DNA-binding response OmpR family regulator
MPTTLRVLVLEDDPMLQRTWTRILKRRGHEVTVAATVAEARAMMAVQPDVLLLDRNVPDGDGWSLKGEAEPGVRVVLMTGQPPPDAPPHFQKPGTTEELYKWVEGRQN